MLCYMLIIILGGSGATWALNVCVNSLSRRRVKKIISNEVPY